MSDVTLSVGGRNYTVSCEDGQQEHVQRLASVIDGKLGAMGANLSSQEAKNLLFAALLLADELHDARRTPVPADSAKLAANLERIATALENAAATFESGTHADL